jgi:hypothetical protein
MRSRTWKPAWTTSFKMGVADRRPPGRRRLELRRHPDRLYDRHRYRDSKPPPPAPARPSPLAIYGTDQYITQYDYEIGPPWNPKAFDTYVRISYPFLHADRIKTPTLFLGGERDFNVPVQGAQQMYQALRSLGIDTRLIIYPNETPRHPAPQLPSATVMERYLGMVRQVSKEARAIHGHRRPLSFCKRGAPLDCETRSANSVPFRDQHSGGRLGGRISIRAELQLRWTIARLNWISSAHSSSPPGKPPATSTPRAWSKLCARGCPRRRILRMRRTPNAGRRRPRRLSTPARLRSPGWSK